MWFPHISHDVITTCDCTCEVHVLFFVRMIVYCIAIICLHRKLSHNKLVQLFGVVTQRSPICLVFEFMENGCLTDFLRARKGSFSQEVLLEMCLDVSEGMTYLETSNFIHRDLVSGVFKVSIACFFRQFVLKSCCLNRLHEIVWFLKITWWRYQILEWHGE